MGGPVFEQGHPEGIKGKGQHGKEKGRARGDRKKPLQHSRARIRDQSMEVTGKQSSVDSEEEFSIQ